MATCNFLIDAIDAYLVKSEDDFKKVLLEAGFLEPEETVNAIEILEESIAKALEEESDLFLTAATDAIDLESFAADIWPDIKLTDDLDEKLTAIFIDQFQSFMPKLIDAYIKQSDNDLMLNQVSKRTLSWIEDWSAELGKLMKLSVHTQLETILKTGIEKGHGIPKFVQSIMDSGIRDSYFKAKRVAVTEVLRAHSVSCEEGIQQSPAVDRKEWIHTGSHRNEPRANHVAISGQIVNKKEAFTLVGADGETYHPQHPRDTNLPASESVNCHCIHRGVVADEILGLPLEERRRLQAEAIAELDEEKEGGV